MALLVPEVVIANALNKTLSIIRTNHTDAVANGQESRSLLYLLFNGVALDNYDFYANVKKLLITTPQDPKHITVSLSYDQNIQSTTPHIFLNLASDTPSTDSIGIGEGDQAELTFDNISGQDEYIKQYKKGYLTTYQVVIVTDNKNETSVLYNLIRAILIALTNHFSLEGLQNLKIGGSDLRLNINVPDKVFTKMITMNFLYEIVTPEVFIQDIFTKIRFILAVDQDSQYYRIQDDDSDSV